MKPRVLLVYPPIVVATSDYPQPFPPLGLAYIGAVIEKAGFEVKILDAVALGIYNTHKVSDGFVRVGLSYDKIKKYLKDYSPDIVGISCSYTSNEKDALNTAKVVKEVLPNALVIMGGAHATISYSQILGDKNVDLVVLGEGELTFLEIVKHYGGSYKNIKGIAFVQDKKVIKTPSRNYIKNLDDIPFPARHLLPMDVYLSYQKKMRTYSMRTPYTTIITSRGCPGRCVFCSIHSIWGHNWRARSPKNVVGEMEYLMREYGIKEFYILDDNISFDKQRVIHICRLIKKRRLNVKLTTPNGIALWTLDEEVLKNLRDVGYYRATFGIEVVDPKTMKYIGKPINIKRAEEIIRCCNKLGIWTQSTFIIGFPDETISSIRATIDFAVNSELDFASFYIATPYAGTQLYEDFRSHGLIDDNASYASVNHSGVNTLHFKSSELTDLKNEAYSLFFKKRLFDYLKPSVFVKRLLPKIRDYERFKFFLKIVRNFVAVQLNSRKSGDIQLNKLKV